MFKQEIELLMTMNHENIIKCYGALDTGDVSPVMLLEYAPNGCLFDFLKSKESLPLDLIEIWTKQMTNAIKYLHDKDVAHMDIKSPNFLITREMVLKLSDFGLSEIIVKTKSTTDKGTTRWMAPEIYTDLKASKASDMYSFGIVVWELWTCEIPFDGQTPTQIMWNVFNGERPPIPDKVPLAMRELIELCWARDPHTRPSIDHVQSNLV